MMYSQCDFSVYSCWKLGCHFLLPCMKVKNESDVAQLCPIPIDPMDCSLPGSSVRGIFQARVLEWGAIAFSRKYSQCLLKIFATVSCGEETCARGRKWGFTGVSAVKKLPASAADTGPIPVGKVPGEGVAAHSSVLAWRVPWAEGAVGLQPTGSHRVARDRVSTRAVT